MFERISAALFFCCVLPLVPVAVDVLAPGRLLSTATLSGIASGYAFNAMLGAGYLHTCGMYLVIAIFFCVTTFLLPASGVVPSFHLATAVTMVFLFTSWGAELVVMHCRNGVPFSIGGKDV